VQTWIQDANCAAANFSGVPFVTFDKTKETMDFGYPQTLSVDVLKMYINLGVVKVRLRVPPIGRAVSYFTIMMSRLRRRRLRMLKLVS